MCKEGKYKIQTSKMFTATIYYGQYIVNYFEMSDVLFNNINRLSTGHNILNELSSVQFFIQFRSSCSNNDH